MNIGLSALTYDPLGHVMLPVFSATDLHRLQRRANKVQTLDGVGAAVNDRGTFASDLEWTFRWRDSSYRETVKRMIEIYPEIRVSTETGVYRGIPMMYREEDGISQFAFSVLERLDVVAVQAAAAPEPEPEPEPEP